jgi:HK97 family phage portal protein
VDLIGFIRRLFKNKTKISLTDQLEELAKSIMFKELAIASAVNMIASTISKCEFRTFIKDEPKKADEYYLWNIEPNKNENSSIFIQKMVSQLIYDNEVLVVDIKGQLYVADSFTKTDYALKEDVFSDIQIKTLSLNRTYKASEVIYLKLNNDNVRRYLDGAYDEYGESISHAFRIHLRNGREKGVLEIDGTMSAKQGFNEELRELMNTRFKPFFDADSAVLPITKGYSYTDTSKSGQSLPSDINERIDYAFEMSGRAFRIPKALLLGDVSDVKEITKNYLTFCIDPLVDMIEEEIIRKRYGLNQFVKGNYLRINTNAIKHIDVFDAATAADKLISSGLYCIDDLRVKLGDIPLKTEWSTKHYITKNYAEASQLEHLDQTGKGEEDE